MQELSAVFGQVQELLSAGISIIPVRDKEETTRSGAKIAAKVAYTGWKKYQSEIIAKEQLWHEMEYFKTTAVAMICGKVSGNLELIDIDSKHWPGIDGRIFADFKQIYPDLFARMRINKTPSGGYHILYRIADGLAGGNRKLAYKSDQKECGIETRGEGGYALAPPSMGYSVHSGGPIPLITSLERDGIINLMESYNERIKVVKPIAAPRAANDYYDENPFDHFNGSIAAEDVLSEFGYSLYNDHDNYRRWTRPGREAVGVSVTFRKDFRLYYFFTSSTDFEQKKWMQPTTILSKLKFNGDNKAMYRWLVDNGYGKIKHSKEQEIITRSSTYGSKTPANLSTEAKTWIDEALTAALTIHPHGIFWSVNDKGTTVISREKLYTVAEGLGYRLYDEDITRIEGYKIHRHDSRYFFDALKSYIKIEDAEEYEKVFNAIDEFIQKSGKHVISSLLMLDTGKILHSTKHTSYKFYSNCYLSITATSVTINQYDTIPGLIFEDSIQHREYSFVDPDQYRSCLYHQLLHHAIGISPLLFQVIGYYAHEYKDEEGGYFAILSEICEDPRAGGGSGKNIFSNLFKYTTTYNTIPGTQVQFNEKFLQSWNGEKIFSIADVPKKFDFMFLKAISDGKGIVKKLYSNEASIASSDMPKMIVSTNYSYEISDGGLRRRIIPIEFTDFFTRAGGVNAYFNAMFPQDWTEQDWLGFDNIIAMSIQSFLAGNSRLKPAPLTATGWLKQFEQVYGQLTRQFIVQHIEDWQLLHTVKNDLFTQQYNDFCKENGINIKFQLSSQLMNRSLEEYCQHHSIYFNKSEVIKENGTTHRCREFGNVSKKDTDLPF